MKLAHWTPILALAFMGAGCGSSSSNTDGSADKDGSSVTDGGTKTDGSTNTDGGTNTDASVINLPMLVDNYANLIGITKDNRAIYFEDVAGGDPRVMARPLTAGSTGTAIIENVSGTNTAGVMGNFVFVWKDADSATMSGTLTIWQGGTVNTILKADIANAATIVSSNAVGAAEPTKIAYTTVSGTKVKVNIIDVANPTTPLTLTPEFNYDNDGSGTISNPLIVFSATRVIVGSYVDTDLGSVTSYLLSNGTDAKDVILSTGWISYAQFSDDRTKLSIDDYNTTEDTWELKVFNTDASGTPLSIVNDEQWSQLTGAGDYVIYWDPADDFIRKKAVSGGLVTALTADAVVIILHATADGKVLYSTDDIESDGYGELSLVTLASTSGTSICTPSCLIGLDYEKQSLMNPFTTDGLRIAYLSDMDTTAVLKSKTIAGADEKTHSSLGPMSVLPGAAAKIVFNANFQTQGVDPDIYDTADIYMADTSSVSSPQLIYAGLYPLFTLSPDKTKVILYAPGTDTRVFFTDVPDTL